MGKEWADGRDPEYWWRRGVDDRLRRTVAAWEIKLVKETAEQTRVCNEWDKWFLLYWAVFMAYRGVSEVTFIWVSALFMMVWMTRIMLYIKRAWWPDA